jgi:hypothetical protein
LDIRGTLEKLLEQVREAEQLAQKGVRQAAFKESLSKVRHLAKYVQGQALIQNDSRLEGFTKGLLNDVGDGDTERVGDAERVATYWVAQLSRNRAELVRILNSGG